MKNIKNLEVTITYSVGLEDLNMPENVYNELEKAYDNSTLLDNCTTIVLNKYPNAIDWLSENIQEKDCFNWECEINMFE